MLPSCSLVQVNSNSSTYSCNSTSVWTNSLYLWIRCPSRTTRRTQIPQMPTQLKDRTSMGGTFSRTQSLVSITTLVRMARMVRIRTRTKIKIIKIRIRIHKESNPIRRTMPLSTPAIHETQQTRKLPPSTRAITRTSLLRSSSNKMSSLTFIW